MDGALRQHLKVQIDARVRELNGLPIPAAEVEVAKSGLFRRLATTLFSSLRSW